MTPPPAAAGVRGGRGLGGRGLGGGGLGGRLVVAGAALGTDLGTQAWALHRLRGGARLTALHGVVQLRLVTNTGAAFGIGAGHTAWVAAAEVLGVALLGAVALRARGRAAGLGAALALGGAAGNLVDRVLRPPGGLHGAVVDWIHLSFYPPTFNLADVWLRTGLLVVVVALARRGGPRGGRSRRGRSARGRSARGRSRRGGPTQPGGRATMTAARR